MTESDSKVIAPAMQSKKRSTKKLTTKTFIERARLIHGDIYDYSLVDYINTSVRVKIICPTHGIFEQSPSVHIYKGGCGCPTCWQERRSALKQNPFNVMVEEANKQHNFKFKYHKETYKGARYKVGVTCPLHGYFEVIMRDHISSKYGCVKCSGLATSTKEEFISTAISIHGDRYDYSIVDYLGSHKNVEIICKIHGVFLQKPNGHIHQKQGCPECGNIKKGLSQRTTQDEFIRRAKKIHGELSFEKSLYQTNNQKVTVTCVSHGDFKIKPNHLINRKQGCPICGRENQGWSRSSYKALADQFHNGLSNIYLVKMTGNNESFYKVGITFHSVKHRFRGHCPYEYKQLLIVQGEASFIWSLERQIHRILKVYNYEPKLNFPGQTECFSHIPKEVHKLLDSIDKSDQLQLIA